MAKKNNLNELNEILFDSLRKVSKGEMDNKQAASVIGLGQTIVGNAKIQLQAMKMSGSSTPTPLIGLESKTTNRYEASKELAKKKGYSNVAEAIKDMGKENWARLVDTHMEEADSEK